MKIKNQILLKKYMDASQYGGALAEIEENLKYEPDDAYLNYYKAKILFLLDRCPESVVPLKKALHLDSKNADICILAAEIFTKLKYYMKAEEFYLYILKYFPENPETLANYAYLKALTGDLDESAKLIAKAVEKDPDNVRVTMAAYKISHLRGDSITGGAKRVAEWEADGMYETASSRSKLKLSAAAGAGRRFNWKFQLPFFLLNMVPPTGFYHYGKYREMGLYIFFYLMFAGISYAFSTKRKSAVS